MITALQISRGYVTTIHLCFSYLDGYYFRGQTGSGYETN